MELPVFLVVLPPLGVPSFRLHDRYPLLGIELPDSNQWDRCYPIAAIELQEAAGPTAAQKIRKPK